MSPARTVAWSSTATGGWLVALGGWGSTSTVADAVSAPLETEYVKLQDSWRPAGAERRSDEWSMTSAFRPVQLPMDSDRTASPPPAGSESFSKTLTTVEELSGSSARSFSALGVLDAVAGSRTSIRMRLSAVLGPSETL